MVVVKVAQGSTKNTKLSRSTCGFVKALHGFDHHDARTQRILEPREFALPFSTKELETIRDKKVKRKPPPFRSIKNNVYLTSKPPVAPRNETTVCKCGLENMVERVMTLPRTRAASGKGEIGIKMCGENCINRMMMIECTDEICSGSVCLNRDFSNRNYKKMDIEDMNEKGFGLIAREKIRQGEFIIEYMGEVIDDVECERRMALSKANGDKHFYMMEIGKDAVVDARYRSNYARFLNHSCEPNAETQKWNVGGYVRIGIFALRDIVDGEELTIDYKFCHFGEEAERCLCGASTCRKVLTSQPPAEMSTKKDLSAIQHPTVRPEKTTSFALLKRANMDFEDLDFYGSKRSRLFISHAIPLDNRVDYEMYATRALKMQKQNISTRKEVLVERVRAATKTVAHSCHGIVDWSSVLAEIKPFLKVKPPIHAPRIRRNLLQARVKRLYDIECLAESSPNMDTERIERLVDTVRLSYRNANLSANARNDMNEDVCFRCNQAGELWCCDGCPAAYHLVCANLTQIDASSEWFCPQCRKRKFGSSWRR